MRIIYNRMMKMFGPDNGGASGAGDAANVTSDADIFAKIDLDNLDDESKKALEQVKGQFATLQNDVKKASNEARAHQSERDRATAELQRVKASVAGPTQSPQLTGEQEIEQIMINAGVKPDAAKSQAPLMNQLLAAQRQQILKEVGAGIAPLAGTVLNQAAEQAFNLARATDRVGAFAIPEVAQSIWASCQQMTAEGTTITPEIVQNLKAMHFLSHVEKNGGTFGGSPTPMNRMPNVTPGFNTGGFTFPGAGFNPGSPTPPADANAPKHVLDPATRTAVESVSKFWGITPK